MPWRARYIVPRPHPLAVSVYLLVLLLGVFSVAGVFDFRAVNQIIGTSWQYMWEWLLTIGGASALVGVNAKKDLEGGLLLEAAGALSAALGFFTYVAALGEAFGLPLDSRITGWLFYLILGVGCGWRAVQAMRDRNLATKLGARIDQRRRQGEEDI